MLMKRLPDLAEVKVYESDQLRTTTQ